MPDDDIDQPAEQPGTEQPVTTGVQRHAASQAEYGRYVAAGPIDIDGVRAFNEGSQVPISHVERGVVTTEQVIDLQNTEA